MPEFCKYIEFMPWFNLPEQIKRPCKSRTLYVSICERLSIKRFFSWTITLNRFNEFLYSIHNTAELLDSSIEEDEGKIVSSEEDESTCKFEDEEDDSTIVLDEEDKIVSSDDDDSTCKLDDEEGNEIEDEDSITTGFSFTLRTEIFTIAVSFKLGVPASDTWTVNVYEVTVS